MRKISQFIRDSSKLSERAQNKVRLVYYWAEFASINICALVLFFIFCFVIGCRFLYAQDIKQPNVAGAFYPDNPKELSQIIDGFLEAADHEPMEGDIFALISPHAGYGYSGAVAAYGYKLIKSRSYKTVVVIGPSHQYGFSGVSVYPQGFFRTPLGDLEIDKEFAQKLLNKDKEVFYEPRAFAKEHSVEVQLPFLQKTLTNFKIVPIVMGDCPISTCKKFAGMLKEAIGGRKDILIIASSDMAHRYDFEETQKIDEATLPVLKEMDYEGLYYGFREGKTEMCGMLPVVSTIILAQELGYNRLEVLKYTNSAEVTGKKVKGAWTVGYSASLITAADSEGAKSQSRISQDQKKGEIEMLLNKEQKKKMLELARKSIENYLKTGKELTVGESDPVLIKQLGAFVTLHKNGNLRGCIGNIIGQKPLYLTIRDMAIEAAVGDPRFRPMVLDDLKGVEIEISVLSPLEKIDDPAKIILGTHGVLIKKGFHSGVFLPQVASETGWSKEEFMSELCSQKAGLSPDAWKDKTTDIYIFTAEVFSEKETMPVD